MRTRLIAGTIAACMLLTAAPVVAQEDSPAPGTSAAPAASDGTDIVDLIPETIGGMIPEISVVRGSEHFDGLDAEDDLDAQQIASLEEFVSTLGASVEDMTSISAVTIDGEALSFMAGIQVEGADPQGLLTFYIETLITEMGEPYQELGEIGGKTATLIIDEAFEDGPPLYVYGSGSRVWLIVADENTVEELLASLP
jgi:hypothetical protein